MNCLFFIIFFGKWFFLLNLSFKVLTVVDDWESSKLHLCNKLAPFKTRLCTLKALNYWFSVVSKQVGLKTFKWATIHHHSSKGSKTVTCQSWKSEKNSATWAIWVWPGVESPIFVGSPTLTGHSFGVLWAMMMNSSSFENPKSYLCRHYLRYSILALLR